MSLSASVIDFIFYSYSFYSLSFSISISTSMYLYVLFTNSILYGKDWQKKKKKKTRTFQNSISQTKLNAISCDIDMSIMVTTKIQSLEFGFVLLKITIAAPMLRCYCRCTYRCRYRSIFILFHSVLFRAVSVGHFFLLISFRFYTDFDVDLSSCVFMCLFHRFDVGFFLSVSFVLLFGDFNE